MNNFQITKSLINLGYRDFVVRGDTLDGIEWVVEPEVKPTNKQITDAIANLPTTEQQQLEREAKLDSAITKLKQLGLTESEAKIIIGLE